MFPAGRKGWAMRTPAPARSVGNHKKGEKSMKKTSKILSAFLALVTVFALAVPASAAAQDIDIGSVSADWGNGGGLVFRGVTGVTPWSNVSSMNVYDVVVGGGFTANFEFSSEYDRQYNFYIEGRLDNTGDEELGWESTNPKVPDIIQVNQSDGISEYSFTCTQDMVGKLLLCHLYWGDTRHGEDQNFRGGQFWFYMRVVNAGGSVPSVQPGTSAATGVKPAAGVSVMLSDGSGEFAYTVKAGDNLKKIAAYFYGNADVYKLIYERNKSTLASASMIYAGQTIILPSYAAVAQGVASVKPAQPSTSAHPDAPGTTAANKPAPGVSMALNDGSGEFLYTIKSGDTLGSIAAYYYGNVNVYKLIYERNKGALASANAVYAGQTIILPSYAAVAQGVAKI